MLIHSSAQLLTLTPAAQRGSRLGELGVIPDGAVLIREDKIAETGSSQEMLRQFPDEPRYDASGHVVMPGFVDPHNPSGLGREPRG